MTYPPPGDNSPQQYHLSGEPPQQPPPPGDPYSQGYGAQPPPGYGAQPPPGGYQQPQYGQPPNMTPPVGVQPGYPPEASPALPPPIPPPKQGGNLGIILGVVIGLVLLLGVAAVLIVPGMLEDDDDSASGDDSTSEEATDEPTDEPTEEPTDEPTEEPTDDGTGGGGPEGGWSTPVNSEDYDPNTPEGAAIEWVVYADLGDTDAMEALMCSDPSEDMLWEYDFESGAGGQEYEFLIWGMSREVDGEVQAWADWTIDDSEPSDTEASNAYTMVEEDGAWKLCDFTYL